MTTPDADLALLRAVAEDVMGWRWVQYNATFREHWPHARDLNNRWLAETLSGPVAPADMARDMEDQSARSSIREFPDWFGRDWEQVAERMRGLGWRLTLTDHDGRIWAAHYWNWPNVPDDDTQPFGAGDTIGEAVCRAALAAVRESDTTQAGGEEP